MEEEEKSKVTPASNEISLQPLYSQTDPLVATKFNYLLLLALTNPRLMAIRGAKINNKKNADKLQTCKLYYIPKQQQSA